MKIGVLKKQARAWAIPAMLALATLTVGMLSGCESVNDWMTAERVNYHSAHAGPALEVPNDLASVPQNQHFVLPDTPVHLAPSSQTASSHTATVSGALTPKRDIYVLPAKSKADLYSVAMQVEKEEASFAGPGRYWLVLSATQLNALWPPLRTFWHKNGFTLKEDHFNLGWLETDWAENRAQIPNDWFRRAAGKFVDILYSSGTLDKFRTVVESDVSGHIRLTILHYGMEEVLVGRQKDSSIWQERPRNPELEKAFLGRLMQSLGASEEVAQVLIAQAKLVPAHVTLNSAAAVQNKRASVTEQKQK